MIHLIHAIGTAALWTGVVAGVGFCGLYALTAPWWRSMAGWHLMSWAAALTLILGWLTYRSLHTGVRSDLGDEIARTVVYGAVALLLLWRLALLWRTQIHPALIHKKRTRR